MYPVHITMVDPNVLPRPRHKISATGFTFFILPYTRFISKLTNMASKPEKASWNEEETTALINYLILHKAEAGDGANFKDATFRAVADSIAHLRTAGASKTAKMCKTKWAGVGRLLSTSFIV